MVFQPADGDQARWRRVDDYIDTRKQPGDLITFREVQDFLEVDKPTAANVIHQVRIRREKTGKPTLVTMRGAGWLLARPDQELEEDTRRHEHLLNATESRVRLLGSIQSRRSELTSEERRILDFKTAQAATQATVLGTRKTSAADILSTSSTPHLPITTRNNSDNEHN
jgi:hypothetical protein